MLRHASTQARQVFILDFLAPSLIRPHFRSNSTATRTQPQTKYPQPAGQKPSFPLQASSPSSLLAKLRTNVHDEENKTSILSAENIDRYNEIIADIRCALDARQRPKELLELWKQLDKLNVFHTLGHVQLAPLSTLMIETFLGNTSKTVKNKAMRKENKGKGQNLDEDGKAGMIGLEPSLKTMVKKIAFLAARNDSWDAIVALMRYYIKEGDTKTVLILYDKFMSLVGDKNLKMDQELQGEGGIRDEEEVERVGETKNLLVTDSELKSRRPPLIYAGRVHLLTAVVIAHIMNGSFKEALGVCLATVVQLDETQTKAFIAQALSHDSNLRAKLNQALEQITVACLISRPAAFVYHVTRLGALKEGRSLEQLYNVIKAGLGGREAFLVADPSLVTESKTIALTAVGWNALLSALLKCEKKDIAGQLWDDMTTFGAPPGISMWTALIDAYGQIHAADDALATWNMMRQQGIEPDTLAYRAIISTLFKGRRPKDAMVMFEAYRVLPVEEGPHRLSLYNSVLHGLCASYDGEAEALRLREIMETEGPKPDLITYNTLINFYGRRQQFQGIAATLRAMQLAGFDGDVFTYTTILSALLKAGKRDGAELVLALMDKQGVKKSAALYTSLIDDQLRQGGESNFQAAMQMLASMEKNPHSPPTEITYTSMLRALYSLSWMDPDELQRTEANILQRMRHRKMSLSLPAYHHLLKACLVYPHGNGVEQAMAYYEEMKRREIPIINRTWYILLAGLINKGEWGIASKLVEELYTSGIHPKGPLLDLVHQINNRTSW
jgi:pentatricopeptide repeat protein